jgi:hypothetical protein
MPGQIKADVLQALDAWKSGKAVRSIELGHTHRMIEHPGMSPRIDLSKRIERDQERAHAYLFHLIDLFSINGVPADHEAFLAACDDYERTFDWGELPVTDRHVFDSERDAAESLAWKALLVGWKRATDGHGEASYIEVSREKQESKSSKK